MPCAALVLSLTACSGSGGDPTILATASPTTASASAQTPDATTVPGSESPSVQQPTATAPSIDTSLAGTVYTGVDRFAHTPDGFLITDADGNATVTFPLKGTSSALTPDLPPGAQVLGAGYTMTGSDSPAVVGVLVVRVPADGLDPESTTTRVETFASDGHSTGHHTIAAADPAGVLYATPTTVVIADAPSGPTVAYRLRTGARAWKSPLFLTGGGDGVAILKAESQYATCESYTGLNADTGARLWAATSNKLLRPVTPGSWWSMGGAGPPRCPSISLTTVDGVGDHVIYMSHPVTFSDQGTTQNNQMYVPKTSKPVGPVGDDAYYDPTTDLVVTSASAGNQGDVYSGLGVTVTEAATGRPVFSLPYAKASKLRLQTVGVAAGRIWATTTDQHLVLDERTGKVLDQGWVDGDQPLVAGQGWYLAGRAQSQSAGGTVDPQYGSLTLVMAASA